MAARRGKLDAPVGTRVGRTGSIVCLEESKRVPGRGRGPPGPGSHPCSPGLQAGYEPRASRTQGADRCTNLPWAVTWGRGVLGWGVAEGRSGSPTAHHRGGFLEGVQLSLAPCPWVPRGRGGANWAVLGVCSLPLGESLKTLRCRVLRRPGHRSSRSAPSVPVMSTPDRRPPPRRSVLAPACPAGSTRPGANGSAASPSAEPFTRCSSPTSRPSSRARTSVPAPGCRDTSAASCMPRPTTTTVASGSPATSPVPPSPSERLLLDEHGRVVYRLRRHCRTSGRESLQSDAASSASSIHPSS